MIRAEKLGYQFGEFSLLSGIDLVLEPGKVVAILGPNGAGKSTLLKLMAGQLRPTSGFLTWGETPLDAMGRTDLARRRGVLPQASQIPFEFLAKEVVLLGRSPHLAGAEKPADLKIAEEAMELTETTRLADRSVVTLSGGELQRVHLARVLAQIWEKPAEGGRVLLLDEPTSSLDPAHQHSTLRLARSWARNGTAVAIVLHDLNLASLYADQIVVLKRGKCMAQGAPSLLLTPAFISQIFGFQTVVHRHPTEAGPLIIAIPEKPVRALRTDFESSYD